MTEVRVGDVVEWTTRGPVSWVSPDGRQIIVTLPDGQQTNMGRIGQGVRHELSIDLTSFTVNVLAPDVRPGDVWRTRDGRLWHALQSRLGDEPVVLLYPAPGGPGEFPEQVHELYGLDRVAFRPEPEDVARQMVDEAVAAADALAAEK